MIILSNEKELFMELGRVLNNVSSFLVDPLKADRSKGDKIIAVSTTIIVGVATLGIAQGLSGLWRHYNDPKIPNDTHNLISNLFKNKSSEKKSNVNEEKEINLKQENNV